MSVLHARHARLSSRVGDDTSGRTCGPIPALSTLTVLRVVVRVLVDLLIVCQFACDALAIRFDDVTTPGLWLKREYRESAIHPFPSPSTTT
jgi:hypothetical protein